MKKLLLVLFIVSLLLGGCASPKLQQQSDENSNFFTENNVLPLIPQKLGYVGLYRKVDYEAGVVCYFNAYGLDCLPITETTLDY